MTNTTGGLPGTQHKVIYRATTFQFFARIVGELLNKHEIAIDVFNKVGSIAKTADFVAAGLKNYDVVSLCNQGYIERIRNGFYKLPNAEEPKEEALISKLLPQGIVCVESALFYYGYSDFAPREWTVAVPRSFSRAIKAMQEVPVKAYYVQKEFYHCFLQVQIPEMVIILCNK